MNLRHMTDDTELGRGLFQRVCVYSARDDPGCRSPDRGSHTAPGAIGVSFEGRFRVYIPWYGLQLGTVGVVRCLSLLSLDSCM